MVSIKEEIKSMRNLCLAGGEAITEVHEIELCGERKQGMIPHITFTLGMPSEQWV